MAAPDPQSLYMCTAFLQNPSKLVRFRLRTDKHVMGRPGFKIYSITSLKRILQKQNVFKFCQVFDSINYIDV